MKSTFRALRHANFKRYFFGQSFSLLGTWVQQVAMSWLVYRLTGSAFLLGMTGFVSQIPVLFLAPFAGVLSDSFDRKKILLLTQVLAMGQAVLLAFLVWTERVEIWHILCLALSLGVISAFEIPARQSLMSLLVDDKKDLSNAIALNSLLVNAARLIGPTIAGITITLFSEAVCFALNALSYLAVILSLMSVRCKKQAVKLGHVRAVPAALKGLREGMGFALHSRPIRSMLMLLASSSFMIMPYIILMPLFATDVFNGQADTMGYLIAPAGLGAVVGNIYLASKQRATGLCKTLVLASVISGSALMLFSQSTYFFLSVFLMLFVGFGFVVQVVSSNILLQHLVDEDKRGRLMSLYTMAYMGVIPLGNLAAGSLAAQIDAPSTLFIFGAGCVTCGLVYALKMRAQKTSLRPVCSEARSEW